MLGLRVNNVSKLSLEPRCENRFKLLLHLRSDLKRFLESLCVSEFVLLRFYALAIQLSF